MRVMLTGDQAEIAYKALSEQYRKMVDSATSYTFDFTSQKDFDKYIELREKEMEFARILYIFRVQTNAHSDAPALEQWEIDLLQGKKP